MSSVFEAQLQLWEDEKEGLMDQQARNLNMRERLKLTRAKREATTENMKKQKGSHNALEDRIELPVDDLVEGDPTVRADAPWMPEGGYENPNRNMFLQLHDELKDFGEWLKMTPREQTARSSFMARLNGAAQSFCPGSQIYVFGSYYTGLSLPTSDMDLCWVVPLEKSEIDNSDPQALKAYRDSLLRGLSNLLLQQQQVSHLDYRSNARVPIVNLKDRFSKPAVEADISVFFTGVASKTVCDEIFQHVFPTETGDFVIQEGVRKYPQFVPLVLFLKVFFQQRGLAETFSGGIGSYLLSVMVLVYLQCHQLSKDPKFWRGMSLGLLLYEFFKWYGSDLNFSRNGLSALDGGRVFDRRDRTFVGGGRGKGKGDNGNGVLCVESPLDPTQDIGNKAFRWQSIRFCLLQARCTLNGLLETWDPTSKPARTNSLIAKIIHTGVGELFPAFLSQSEAIKLKPVLRDAPIVAVVGKRGRRGLELRSPESSEVDVGRPPRKQHRSDGGKGRDASGKGNKGGWYSRASAAMQR